MSSYLTIKMNGEWDFASLVGEKRGGIVCHICGLITNLVYRRCDGRYECTRCFKGDKDIALTARYGNERREKINA